MGFGVFGVILGFGSFGCGFFVVFECLCWAFRWFLARGCLGLVLRLVLLGV